VAENFSDETVVTSIGQLEGINQKEPAVDVLGGPAMGQQIVLGEGETVWGRSPDADILIEDEAISRYHFKIKVKDKIATIEDLNSTNGTFVNGTRVKQHVLQPNDKIQISSATVLRFSYVDPIDTDVHKRIYEMALFDPVTQAHTKRYFLDRIKHEFSHSGRKNFPLSLIMFDLDHFKKVNDTFGHPAGDYVLQKVAEVTQGIVRREDIFARYGGEEFVVLMRDAGEKDASILAERMREAIAQTHFQFEGQDIPVTISLGVACFHHGNIEDAKALIQFADNALYASKEGGRNRVTAHSSLS
jgi:two-component system cell cycle response regulator